MVALVSGLGLGLNLTSAQTLEKNGALGFALQSALQTAIQGQGREISAVNIANGNLVLQDSDGFIAGRGPDLHLLRTYNSQGQGSSQDHWQSFATQRIDLNGQLMQAGSTLVRTDADGSQAVYDFDSTQRRYLTTEGEGAFDTLTPDISGAMYVWTDGSSGQQEFYAVESGRLSSSSDTSGNTLRYSYDVDGRLDTIQSSNGDSVRLISNAAHQLVQIDTTSGNAAGGLPTQTRIYYAYDSLNRLTLVRSDLTPDQTGIADGKVYETRYTYDGSSARIASVVQSDGTSLGLTYVSDVTTAGIQDQLSSITDALGQVTRLRYDTARRQTTVTDALGNVSTYTYDAAGQLSSVSTPVATTRFTYDGQGNVLRVEDGAGRITDMQYDANGNQIAQRDGVGNTVLRRFDANNQQLSETRFVDTDPDGGGSAVPVIGQTTTRIYDSENKNLLRFNISAAGRMTEYRYNAKGDCTSMLQYGTLLPFLATPNVAANSANSAANSASLTPSLSSLQSWVASLDQRQTARTDYTYDLRGQLQTTTRYLTLDAAGNGIIDGSQSSETFIHDAQGQLVQRIDGQGHQTSYVYDGLGHLLSTTDDHGSITTSWDDANKKSVLTQANGCITTSIYNPAGQLQSRTESAAAVLLGQTSYTYDADNRLRMTTDPTGRRRYMLYDGAGQKIADIDALGYLTEYALDGAGQLSSSIQYATPVDVRRLLDASGRPIEISLTALRPPVNVSLDRISRRVLDAAGQLVASINAEGEVTDYFYDGSARLIRRVQHAERVDLAALARGENPRPLASAADRQTRFFYDADGLLQGQLDADGYLIETRYDASQHLQQTIAYATATPDALREAGSLAQCRPSATRADVIERHLIDRLGRTIATIDAENYLTEFSYDQDSQLLRQVRMATPLSLTAELMSGLALTPALLQSLRPAASSEDQVISFGYNALHQLVSQTDADGTVTRMRYDQAGNLIASERAFATEEQRSQLKRYDLQGRVIAELSAEGAALLTNNMSQSQQEAIWDAWSVRYRYDQAGRCVEMRDQNKARILSYYDALGRLTYSINAAGEIDARTYDAQNQCQSLSRFDGRLDSTVLLGLTGGDLTPALRSLFEAANGTTSTRETMTHDRLGRLSTSVLGRTTTQRTYNAFGEQTALRQLDESAQRLQQATYDHRGHVIQDVTAPNRLNLLTRTEYDAFGRATRFTDAAGGVSVREYDRLGRSVAITTDVTGRATRSSTTYDAIGRVLTQTDALNRTIRTDYNTHERSLRITTAEGIVQRITQNPFGQQIALIDGNGNTSSWQYDHDGRLQTQTDAMGRSDSHNYDHVGNEIATRDKNGTLTTTIYDAANRRLRSTVDPDGLQLITQYRVDTQGRVVNVTDSSGVQTRTSYDQNGHIASITVDPIDSSHPNGLNLVTRFQIDGEGKTLSVTSPDGRIVRTEYDEAGRRTTQTQDPDGLNLVTRYVYDTRGNLCSRIDPGQRQTRMLYDVQNQQVAEIDAAGGVQIFQYDAAGQRVQTIHLAKAIDLAGLADQPSITELTDRVNAVADAAQDQHALRLFDKDGRLRASVDGAGTVTTFAYDGNQNLLSRTVLARPLRGGLTAPLAEMEAHSANAATNSSVAEKIALGLAVDTAQLNALAARIAELPSLPAYDLQQRFAYDKVNRLVLQAQAQSLDANGNTQWAVERTSVAADGRSTSHTRFATLLSAAGLPALSGSHPDAQAQGVWMASVATNAADRTDTDVFDNAHRAAFHIDALGAVSRQRFDGAGRVLESIAFGKTLDPATSMNEADLSRLLATSAYVEQRSSRTIYDGAGRAAAQIDALGNVVEHFIDADGNRIKTTRYAKPIAAAALTVNAGLADLHALLITDPADRTERVLLDRAGRVQYVIDALGYAEQREYSAAGDLVRSTHMPDPVSNPNTKDAASMALALQAQRSNPALRTTSFVTDQAGRVTQSTDAMGGTNSTSYNALGQKIAYTNALSARWTYEYDLSGRCIAELDPLGIRTGYQYDTLGQLTARTEAAGLPEQRVTHFAYDAGGRQTDIIYPMVAVYDSANDALLNNGVNASVGASANVAQITQTPAVHVDYDVFGDALANTDVNGNLSYHLLDKAGRVVAEIDALGFVTHIVRDAFGQERQRIRMASPINLSAFAAGPGTMSALRELLRTNDHSADRTLQTDYDAAGNIVKLTESAALIWQNGVALTQSKVTDMRRDAFGAVVEQYEHGQNSNADSSNAAPGVHRYLDYNQRGEKIAQLALVAPGQGYLTTYAYDAAGNQMSSLEYATLLTQLNLPQTPTATLWHPAALPARSSDDRLVYHFYDQLNRCTSEVQSNIESGMHADGSRLRADVGTFYGYDAVGNRISMTDALGNVTRTFYDAAGRISAIVGPLTDLGNGSSLRSLTEFQRDIFGHVVQQIDRAHGATSLSTTGYTTLADPSLDRTTRSFFDAAGRAFMTIDAEGSTAYTSYDLAGNALKQWRTVSDASLDGYTRAQHTVFSVQRFDALGRQIERIEAGAATPVSLNHHSTRYDAFGDVVETSTNGQQTAFFDYDNAGHLWRSNAGDGVTRVFQHDIEGRVTRTLTSASVDLKSASNLTQAVQLAGLSATEVQYDLLGHMIAQTLAADVSAPLSLAAVHADTIDLQSVAGDQVQLQWASLAGLGSGDVRVTMEVDAGAGMVLGKSQIFDASQAQTGVTMALTAGSSVTRIEVAKKNINGEWTIVRTSAGTSQTTQRHFFFDMAAQAELAVKASDNGLLVAGTSVDLQTRRSDTDSWTSRPLVNFGDRLSFNTASLSNPLADGEYQYRIVEQNAGAVAPVTRETGRFTVGATTLRVQATQLYVLLFNRAPDANMLADLVQQLSSGKSTAALAQTLMDSDAGRSRFPAATSPADLITLLYGGALGRAPDAQELTYWRSRLQEDPTGRVGVVLADMLSAIVNYAGTDAGPFSVQKLFNNKVAVALTYATQFNGHDATVATSILGLVTADSTVLALNMARNSVAVMSGLYHRQAAQLFVLLFNLAPDSTDLQKWVVRLQHQESLAQIAQAMLDSDLGRSCYPASANGLEVLKRLCREALGMEPDAETIRLWSPRLERSTPSSLGSGVVDLLATITDPNQRASTWRYAQQLLRNKVTVGLTYADGLDGHDAVVAQRLIALTTLNDTAVALSAAFTATGVGSSTTPNNVRLTQIYTLLFNRGPELDGLNYWLAQIGSSGGLLGVTQSLLDFNTAANTALSSLSDADFITLLYRNAINDPGDAPGVAYWMAQLRITSRAQLVLNFINGLSSPDASAQAQSNAQMFIVKWAAGLTYVMQGGNDVTGTRDIVAAATTDRMAAVAAQAAQTAQGIADSATELAQRTAANAAATAVTAAAAAVELAAALAAQANAQLIVAQDAALVAQNTADAARKSADTAQQNASNAQALATAAETQAAQDAAAAKAALAFAASGNSTEANAKSTKASAAAQTSASAWSSANQLAQQASSAYNLALSVASSTQTNATAKQTALTTAQTAATTATANVQRAQTDLANAQAAFALANRISQSSTTLRTQVAQLYVLLFNRTTPDSDGVDYWIGRLNAGNSWSQIAQNMFDVGVSQNVFSVGASTSTSSTVTTLYRNALNRAPDAGGMAYWSDKLNSVAADQKGGVFVDLINAIVSSPAADPAGVASFNSKVAQVLTLLANRSTAATTSLTQSQSAANTALSQQTNANTNLTNANTALQSAQLAASNANADKNTKAIESTLDQQRLAQALNDKNNSAAAATLASSQAATAATAAATAASQSAAVATLAASLLAQQHTSVARLFVMLFNRTNLNRADADAWALQLASGMSLADLAQRLFEAGKQNGSIPSGLSNTALVQTFYRGGLEQEPDSEGLAYWCAALNNGSSVGGVVSSMVNATLTYAGTVQDVLHGRTRFLSKVADAITALSTQDASIATSARTAATTATSLAAQAQQTATNAADAARKAQTLGISWTGVNVPASAAQLLVARFYALLLNRAPDADGLRYWVAQVDSGQSSARIAQSMLESSLTRFPVGQSATDFVNLLYTALGRTPDAGGLTYWTPLAAQPSQRGQVALNFLTAVLDNTGNDPAGQMGKEVFANKVTAGLTYAVTLGGNDINAASTIFTRVTSGSSAVAISAAIAAVPKALNRTLLIQLHIALLGRSPDLTSYDSLIAQLDSGQSIESIAQGIVAASSALSTASLTNSAFITRLYSNALARSPDSTGQAYWLNRLIAGDSRSTVALNFLRAVSDNSSADAFTLSSRQTLADKTSTALASLQTLTGSESSSAESARSNAAAASTRATELAASSLSAASAADLAAQRATDAVRTVQAYSGPAISTDSVGTVGFTTQSNLQTSTVRTNQPTISLTSDRWGNVLSRTDARSSQWVTRYRYNALNERTDDFLPDDGSHGVIHSSSYYDALGRQIGTQDANGNLTQQQLDAQGNVLREQHADGGVLHNDYDVFGNRLHSSDALNHITSYSYDRLGQLLSKTSPEIDSYRRNGEVGDVRDIGVVRALTDIYRYDELGRRIVHTNSVLATDMTRYDARGNVTATIDAAGGLIQNRYDAQNRLIEQIDGNGVAMRWQYDEHSGRLMRHTDLGGTEISYRYDLRGQLIEQTSTRGQHLQYTYNAAGQLTQIKDDPNASITSYSYDALGQRLTEKTVVAGRVLQDNHLAYDAVGHLRLVADGRYQVRTDYDAVGNRVHTSTRYLDDAGAVQTHDSWNLYDAMNRQLVIDGERNPQGLISYGATGHAITYDQNGNRISDTFLGKQYVLATADPKSRRIQEHGIVVETYSYDALNRLTDTVRDGLDFDVRRYDAAGRIVHSGLNIGDFYKEWESDLQQLGLSIETRQSSYDATGRLQSQTLRGLNEVISTLGYRYDHAGHVDSTTLTTGSGRGASTKNYQYSYEKSDSYQVSQITGSGNGATATTTNRYDLNGHLVEVTDSANAANHRLLQNDSDGRVLRKEQNGAITHTLIVNGEVLGTSGTGTADDNFSRYESVGNSGATSTPSAYLVQAGDTLRGIAKNVWGDSTLWYLIAEANGISSGGSLTAGTALTIPAHGPAQSNGPDSLRPYDASKIIGDTTPTLPMPAGQGGGCGGFGQILIAAIAIAATIYTAGAFASMSGLAGSAGLFEASTAALSGTYGAGVGIAAGTLGGAAGSITSQGAGMAMGMQDHFSWEQVGRSAISGGVSAGVAGGVNSALSNYAAQMGAVSTASTTTTAIQAGKVALSNAITQGLSVQTGLQDHFSWQGVVAAATGSALSSSVAQALNESTIGSALNPAFGNICIATVAGFTSGMVTAALNGGTVSARQVALDAFGNVLGNSLVEQNMEARVANALANAGPGQSESDYWHSPAKTSADQYADTYGGSVSNTGAVLKVSSQKGGELERLSNMELQLITENKQLKDQISYEREQDYIANSDVREFRRGSRSIANAGSDLNMVVESAASENLPSPEAGFLRGLSGGDPYRSIFDAPTSASENMGLMLNGALHSLTSMFVEPAAQYVDIGRLSWQAGRSLLGLPTQKIERYSNLGNAVASGQSLGRIYIGMAENFFSAPSRLVENVINGDWQSAGGSLIETGTFAAGVGGLRGVYGGVNGVVFDVSSTSLGDFLGKGGNKNVYAYGVEQAIAVLQPGKSAQLITSEIEMLNQLNDLGIPTVNARSITVNGQPAILMDQFVQGSKDIVALQNGKVRIVGNSNLLNSQSISDLQNIRNTMVNNNIQINDLQFLIGNDGRAVVADPLKVNVNTPPSNNNLRMIDLLIQSAKKNGSK